MPPVKPPIGVMPQFLWDEQNPAPSYDDYMARSADLKDAIIRYVEAGRLPRIEWVKELTLVTFLAGDMSRPRPACPEPSAN